MYHSFIFCDCGKTQKKYFDAEGNLTEAFVFEHLRSVKEAAGISATAVCLETRAVDEAKKNLQTLANNSDEVLNNFTRAQVSLKKCKEACMVSIWQERHMNEHMYQRQVSQAKIFGCQLVAADEQYRRALEDIINKDPHAFDELNRLAAEIQNVGTLRRGDRAQVVRHGSLVPVEVTGTVGATIAVSIFKTVNYPLCEKYEEGFQTSQQEIRLYPRVALHASSHKLRQRIFNDAASLQQGDEVELLHCGKVICAQVKDCVSTKDSLKVIIDSKSQRCTQCGRAEIRSVNKIAAPPVKKQLVKKKNRSQ